MEPMDTSGSGLQTFARRRSLIIWDFELEEREVH